MTCYPLFSVLGLEIEYMLVDRQTLAVQPKSDEILKALAGELTNEVELGDIAVSNELVLHVIELKNNGPKPFEAPVAQHFQQVIQKLQPFLDAHQLQLLPTGAHPWMNPLTETVRWPHGDKSIYQQYDTIFNCQGHGWSNLQSMHINLPFANDLEFRQLHNTIRLILPLIPALAASTPILDGKPTGLLDSRLHFYEKNQARIPAIAGQIIPEFVSSPADYQTHILEPMYQAIRPFDAKGLLQFEWLNSRGAIPKFNYHAIEIRIVDSQECVTADIAIAQAIYSILKDWAQSSQHLDEPIAIEPLKKIYDQAIHQGMNVQVEDKALLKQWQLPARSMSLRDAWSLLIERVSPTLNQTTQNRLESILQQGNLSERILKACHNDYSRPQLTNVYRQLGDCLLTNQFFLPT